MKDRDLAIKLTRLSLAGVNRTWAAVRLNEPYHRVLRVSRQFGVPDVRRHGPTIAIIVDGQRIPINRETATGRPWSQEEIETALASDKPVPDIARALGRTEASIWSKRYRLSKRVAA